MNQQQVSENQYFLQAMTFLKSCYPGYKPSADEWKTTLGVYREGLSKHSAGAIGSACREASRSYPKYFPSLGEIQQLVTQQGRRRMLSQEKPHQKAIAPKLPVSPQGQQEWINEAEEPFEKLARHWQCESQRLRLDPNEPTPEKVYQRRMREFWEVWEAVAG